MGFYGCFSKLFSVAIDYSRGSQWLSGWLFLDGLCVWLFLAAVFHYGGCGFGVFYGSVLVLLGGLFLLSSPIINGTASAGVIVVALL